MRSLSADSLIVCCIRLAVCHKLMFLSTVVDDACCFSCLASVVCSVKPQLCVVYLTGGMGNNYSLPRTPEDFLSNVDEMDTQEGGK